LGYEVGLRVDSQYKDWAAESCPWLHVLLVSWRSLAWHLTPQGSWRSLAR